MRSASIVVCPRCAGPNVRHSRAHGLAEGLFISLLRLTPYRCADCLKRFYRFAGRTSAAGHRENAAAERALATFLPPQDQVTFQQLIRDMREAEQRVENQDFNQRKVGKHEL
jgi:hypothetical protein